MTPRSPTPAPLTRESLLAQLRATLNRRGLALHDDAPPLRYRIQGAAVRDLVVSPEDVVALAIETNDPDLIERWVEELLAPPLPLPPYLVARSGLRLALEPRRTDFKGSLHSPLTPALAEVLCWTDPQERRITWLTGATLDLWHADPAEVLEVALRNLDRQLAATPLNVEPLAGATLGVLQTDSVFKATLLRAPSLRSVVEPSFGWPVNAVAPCRDFVLLFAESQSAEIIPRLAAVVTREYESSAFPLTAEVLRISDQGIVALGAYG